ncbi:Putative berberine/berberine, FAD-binding domain, PCMH-type, FAD-binding, type PCMH, subdomain 1 [Colletotrichum destructivum]|uniref:Berberine/berberine, FAD-binding domain, PCMH-type, FAD-binding, type PCMH, subdomain 1 n=1 Tax=Colletotrichum destructivum TaxID=34406 RepID=A0AAX4IF07_9PEZI|nr:Putative berberine/berberine, FAD-binding domain, PCMH-type, FAD-binding, type PCMH, subdomain 1 [Colletotrichum destructivum]
MSATISSETIEQELRPRLSAEARLHLPNSAGFDKSNLRFTQYERPTYLAAVEPGCEEDVIQVMRYAREKGVPFAPRSGHHAVTTTMRHLKGGILIDMRSLNKLSFDAEKQQVTVGGGVITDDFVKFLQSVGMEVNVGSCPTTGVIGVAFGAGLGRLQGKYGFLHDNMVSCKLVLADGRVLNVSEESNPDLFWALRGAGHNFGVALEATFRVYPQANGGIHYTWDLEYTLDQCDDVFGTLNSVHESMPPELAIFVLWIRQSDGGRKHHILVNVVWSGPEADADAWVDRFRRLDPVLDSGKVTTSWADLPWTTYKGMNKMLSRPEVWTLAPNKMMGAACVERFDLATTRAFLESVRDMNEAWAGKGFFGAMFECLPHQKVRELSDEATAFPWRWGSNHFLMLMATPLDVKHQPAFEAHLDRWKREFIATSGYGRLQQYVNYGNTTSSMRDPPEALYGYEPWRLEKLRALKRQYDPENVFRWYQPLIEEGER